MAEQTRAFKGVWIPAEIWLNENLSLQEKAVLAEIDSFCSRYASCYASNEHFANFIGVGARRIQKIIKSLEDKRLIEREVTYKKGTKEIEKRFLRVRYPSCPKVRGGGEEKFMGGGVQKFAENNTGMNNTMNNTINSVCGAEAPPENTTSEKPKKSPSQKKFIPPTLEEVRGYVREKRLKVDPQKFYDYYEAGNWHDSSGKPVKSWKQKCLTWDKHDNGRQVSTQPKDVVDSDDIDWSQFDG